MASDSGAQETGNVSGFVYDASDGEALIAATIQLPDLDLGTLTNHSGYFVLTDVPGGQQRLRCSYIGYATHARDIQIRPGRSQKLSIELEPEAVEIAGVVIRADSMRNGERLFQKSISQVTLAPRQINAIPQVAEADLLRSLQSLPGILPLSDFSSALYVRGGTPDQNLYMVDGSDVYNPEHAFGIFSTFNTDAIKQVELSKGGFGARYGGRLSSVLDVTNLDGNREEFEGTASVSLLSAKTTLQTPLGQSGSLSGSIRRTYFDKTVGRRLEDIPDYYFFDGNFKAFIDLDADNKLTISGYGGRDFLDLAAFNPDATEETGLEMDWGNKTGSARWTRVITPRMFSTLWLTGSRFSSDFLIEAVPVEERNLVSDITAKGSLEYHISKRWISRFGFEQKRMHVLYRQDFPAALVNIDSRPEHDVLFGQANWRPNPHWDVEAGLRYNQFRSAKVFHNLAPRMSFKYRLSEAVTVRGASGMYYQYLHRVPRFAFTDIYTISNEYQDEARAFHFILGVQREFRRNFQLELEGYLKEYVNLYQYNQTSLTELEETGHDEESDPIFTNTRGIFNQGDGTSIGAEALVRKDTGALTGWLAYSYARTRYRFGGINQDRSFFPRHDRTSTVNLVMIVDVKNALRKIGGRQKRQDVGKYTLGVNFVYGTGQPFTEPGSSYIIASSQQDPERDVYLAPTAINNIRIPAYARLDISLTYHRDYGGWSVSPYLQIFNVGNRKNVWFIDYDFSDGLPDADTTHMFPLLPTIGVTFKF